MSLSKPSSYSGRVILKMEILQSHEITDNKLVLIVWHASFSAYLTAISFFKKLEKQKPNCEMMWLYYFHRFWRCVNSYL